MGQIEAEIGQALDALPVRVLYAVESGSRAWGFASLDSDFDVRFVYANPLDWYLSTLEHRDVIEEFLPHDIDLSGWDIRKAFRLLLKSNPPLLEWLGSPIVYREEAPFMAELRAIAEAGWSAKHLMHHYHSMARTNFRTYLQTETVRGKKYLYVLRPLLCCRWIERENALPPVLFDHLVAAERDQALLESIARLLEAKMAGKELDEMPRDPVLHHFIQSELARHDDGIDAPHRYMDVAALDDLLRRTILAV